MSAQLPQGILKVTPDSFVVQELLSDGTAVPLHEETSVVGPIEPNPITVFHMVKRGVAGQDALTLVARQLGVKIGDISSHGIKDRHAHTAQEIGVRGNFNPTFEHDNIVLRQVGSTQRTLLANQHRGNRFRIHVISNARSIDRERIVRVPNYFGTQRFGTPRGYEVGKFLLEGDLLQAEAILREERLGVKIDRLARRYRSLEDLLFGEELEFEVGIRILQWQSHLWNLRREELGVNAPERLPMWTPELDEYDHLWNPEEVTERAVERLHRFIRPTWFYPGNLYYERKLVGWDFSFDLPGGAYATVLLSQVFSLTEKRIS